MMIRHSIRINTGDNDITTTYYFVHKDWATISEDDDMKAFDDAVKELNHVYKDYGRFATQTGVARLFSSFGFERTTSD